MDWVVGLLEVEAATVARGVRREGTVVAAAAAGDTKKLSAKYS